MGIQVKENGKTRILARAAAKPARELSTEELKQVGGGSNWYVLCSGHIGADSFGRD